MKKTLLLAGAATLFGVASAQAAVLYGPTPYLSQADSPFVGHTGWMVEDFEDGLLMDGVSSIGGMAIGPSWITDSVDGDDGAIDGFGTAGSSYFTPDGNGGAWFMFHGDILGFVPKSVGIVWTDGAGTITFEAFDTNGASLGVLTGNHADGSHLGETGDDRFYGVSNWDGIGSLHIRNSSGGIEVDHVQFSASVPAPSAAALLGLGAMFAGRRRR